MTTLGDAIAKRKPRIVAALAGSLRNTPGWQKVEANALDKLLGELFDALILRMRVADSPALGVLLRRELRAAAVPKMTLLASLVRLARELRAVLFAESTGRRVASLAS